MLKSVRSRNQTDIWQIPRIPGNQTIHPTEKPIDMMKRIIENSSEEGGGGDREWSGALNCSYSKSAMGYF
ncbi:DNA methyltransferase [Paenibacillus sp. FSL R7-269]|uniref:DNA methyltransferase n=1 Tax=Paenibacillus sp. FSL R7-269 TaxID=1226755 RepID=UPI0012EC7175|nr:DNA methyltransferase [Paenibacillus sp. FSL R7-269]